MTDAPDATSSPSPQAPAAAEPAPRPTASLPEGRTGASDAAGAAVDRTEGAGDGADAGTGTGGNDGGNAEAGAATGAPRARRSRGGRGRRRSGQAGPKAAGTADDDVGTVDADEAEGAGDDHAAEHPGDRAAPAPADAGAPFGPRRDGGPRRRPDAARPPRRPAQAQAQSPKGQAQQQQSSRNKVHPVLQRLFELYPSMFGARFLPLKLGVYQDLLERHGDEFKAEDLKIALGLHARSTRYLDAVAAGHPRHDLEAKPVEPVAPEHIHHAILEVFRRRQSRTPDDLSAALRDRIIAAIEASGVGRDAYAERVRARDVKGNAALDDALAELGRQGAKREALLRAFETTGKTEAEFADMYGMEPREVTRTLQRARKDQADAQAFAEAQAAAAEAAAMAGPATRDDAAVDDASVDGGSGESGEHPAYGDGTETEPEPEAEAEAEADNDADGEVGPEVEPQAATEPFPPVAPKPAD
ncbi:ProQ/FINO family protein [Variovorax sp. PvP013]|uniref:ProQ/FINO family protein n=1 Tax=Variovorax sp. PvP013 TaxID=3156435 RepID=UPI003D263334